MHWRLTLGVSLSLFVAITLTPVLTPPEQKLAAKINAPTLSKPRP
jgi:multidrug efflux pump subunit AcrB